MLKVITPRELRVPFLATEGFAIVVSIVAVVVGVVAALAVLSVVLWLLWSL